MSDQTTPLKVIFAPGCFDTFDGTQEELDQLMAEIQETFASMTPDELAAQSRLVDEADLDGTFDEVMQQIATAEHRTLQ